MPPAATTQWVCLAVSGALSLAAALFYRALRASSPVRMEELNSEFARYRELPDMDDALIVTGWIKSILYAFWATSIGLLLFANHGVNVLFYAIAAGVSVASVLVFETVALFAVGHHRGMAMYRLVPAIAALTRASKWVLGLGTKMWSLTARLSGAEGPPPAAEAAEEEILDAVSEGEREGVIADEEREMIENLIEFKDLEVAAIMTPRTETDTVSAAMSLREAIAVAVESGHSRLPAYAGTSDNVVGIFHVKDALPHITAETPTALSVKDIMRPPVFVPETKRIRDLLQDFRRDRVHLAVVVDEYGGTSGIVTIEDILEEIVGEIGDEYDDAEAPLVRVTGPGRAVVEGSAPVYEVNRALDLALEEEAEYETIAGYVLFQTGRIPKAGETVDIAEVKFRIIDADNRRIKRMMIDTGGGTQPPATGQAEPGAPPAAGKA